MRLEDCRKKEKLHAVKPKFQVTGVSFGGYGGQYVGKQKRNALFGRNAKFPSEVSEGLKFGQTLHENMDMVYRGRTAGTGYYPMEAKSARSYGENLGVKARKKSGVISEVHFPKEGSAQGIVRQNLKPQEESPDRNEKYEEANSAMSNSERAYFAALALVEAGKRAKNSKVQDKKTKAEDFTAKKRSGDTQGKENITGKKERVLDRQKREGYQKDRVLDQRKREGYQKDRVLDQRKREGYHKDRVLDQKKREGFQKEHVLDQKKRERFQKERALDKWKQETAAGRYAGGNLSQDELTRLCNVRPNQMGDVSGVRSRADMAQNYTAENEEPEPWVCSEKEREKIRQKKADKTENSKEKKDEEHSKKHKIDKVKWKLLKRYVIREMIHEEGKQDPNAHFRLAGQIIGHDLARLAVFIGKLILKLLLQLFMWLLPVILIASIIVISVMAGYSYIINPISYYDNIYDREEEIAENPLYLKNVVQEKCRDFAGEMQTLEDNWRHDVSYPYENYPDADIVTIVYLAQLCTADNYKDRTTNREDGYPPYLLVDTEEEKALLDSVFSQFNYITSTFTIISIQGDDGESHPVPGFDTKIYCLTLQDWKLVHENELSEDAKKLLEELEEKIGETGGTSGDFIGSVDAVPVEDLEIPDGVDENLIYMAGFIRAEAGNQPALGKTAVAYVILNRAGGPSGNIKGVLLAPYQFSCYIPYHTVEQYLTAYASMTQEQREADSCYQAAMGAYYGTSANPIGDMKYYCNPKYCSAGETKQWEKIRAKNSPEEIIIIGDHVFCKNCW